MFVSLENCTALNYSTKSITKLNIFFFFQIFCQQNIFKNIEYKDTTLA